MPVDASADHRKTRSAPAAAQCGVVPGTPSQRVEFDGHVGALLRAMHDSVMDEPVPSRFLDLLRRMDEASGLDLVPTPAEPG